MSYLIRDSKQRASLKSNFLALGFSHQQSFKSEIGDNFAKLNICPVSLLDLAKYLRTQLSQYVSHDAHSYSLDGCGIHHIALEVNF